MKNRCVLKTVTVQFMGYMMQNRTFLFLIQFGALHVVNVLLQMLLLY